MVRNAVSLLICCMFVIFALTTHPDAEFVMNSPKDNMEIEMILQHLIASDGIRGHLSIISKENSRIAAFKC